MKKYVTQLLRDLQKAKHLNNSDMDIPKGRGIRENENQKRKSIAEWTGIPKSAFPPYGQLNSMQMRAVVDEVDGLWESFNWCHDLDVDLPVHVYYQLLTLFWDKEVPYLPESGFDIRFCRNNSSSCWLKEWCMCAKTVLYSLPEKKDVMI